MRTTPLSREDKDKLEKVLRELNLLPPVAGSVVLNIDAQRKVANAEARVVWR